MGDVFEYEYEKVNILGWDTLEGQLQRGRGLGYLRALEDPAAAREILERCITHDPRQDGQVETRSDYYAGLAVEIGMGVDGLDAYLREPRNDRRDWGTYLTVSVLARMSALGRSDALAIIRNYIAYGQHWDSALHFLIEDMGEFVLDGIPEIICERFSSGSRLEESMAYGVEWEIFGAIWERWSTEYPCIKKLVDEVWQIEEENRQKHPRQKVDKATFAAMSIGELLATANAGNYWRGRLGKLIVEKVSLDDEPLLVAALEGPNLFAWLPAFLGLQKLGKDAPWHEAILVKTLEALNELPEGPGPHVRTRRSLSELIGLLPPDLTLSPARDYLNSANWHLETMAEDVMEKHATLEDVPLVVSALRDAIDAADPNGQDDKSSGMDNYRTCGLLDIMVRFEGIGVVPEVEKIYLQATYAFSRMRAAQAMSVNAPEWFAEKYAAECLWDCEYGTREIGCAFVGLEDKRVVVRLRELAENVYDDEVGGLRASARNRLAEL